MTVYRRIPRVQGQQRVGGIRVADFSLTKELLRDLFDARIAKQVAIDLLRQKFSTKEAAVQALATFHAVTVDSLTLTELRDLVRWLEIRGTSAMNKPEVAKTVKAYVRAVAKKNNIKRRRQTAVLAARAIVEARAGSDSDSDSDDEPAPKRRVCVRDEYSQVQVGNVTKTTLVRTRTITH